MSRALLPQSAHGGEPTRGGVPGTRVPKQGYGRTRYKTGTLSRRSVRCPLAAPGSRSGSSAISSRTRSRGHTGTITINNTRWQLPRHMYKINSLFVRLGRRAPNDCMPPRGSLAI